MKVLVLLLVLSLLACAKHDPMGTITSGKPPQSSGPGMGSPEAAVKKQPNLENSEQSFINNTCSKNFANLDSQQQQDCIQKISKVCSEIDIDSQEVEAIPAWEPKDVPSDYIRYVGNNLSSVQKKNHYTCSLLSYIFEANSVVLVERARLKKIFKENKKQRGRSFSRDIDLKHLMQTYELKSTDTKEEFLEKVDIIPPSIILAMGALESGWMTVSRFAWEGNNIFGRHDSSSCIIDEECIKAKGSNVRLVKYSNLRTAILDQVRYLNRKAAYKSFRQKRKRERQQNGSVYAMNVTSGFYRYSGIGHSYAARLNGIIGTQTRWYKYDSLSIFTDL